MDQQISPEQLNTLGKISKLLKRYDKLGQPPKEKKQMTPEAKQALLDRLNKGREAKAKAAAKPAPKAKA